MNLIDGNKGGEESKKKMPYVKPLLSKVQIEMECGIAADSLAKVKPGTNAGDVEVLDWQEKEIFQEHTF